MIILNNKKASAQFFHLIWEYAPKTQKIYIIASILLIAFQTGFIFSKELSEIYNSNIDTKSKKTSIMNKNSFFNQISSFFDIVVLARSLSPGFLIFVQVIILATTIIINLSFRRFDLAKKLINFKKSVRSRNRFMVYFSVLMMNYDIFFFVLSMVGFNSIPCRKITVIEKRGREVNYLEVNSFENEFFDSWDDSSSEIEVRKSVSYLNDRIECLSKTHIFMSFSGLLILFNNVLLKVMANKLMKFVPSFKVFACKFGDSDLVYDLILMIILITKTFSFIFFRDKYNYIRLIFIIYFILLIFGYSVLFTLTPYYNFYQHRLKCFQVLYLLNLTGFSIIVRETNFKVFDSEMSTIMFMMITMTLLIKLNDNLSSFGIQDFIKHWKGQNKDMSSRDVLKVYYIISHYIKTSIENDDKKYLTGTANIDDVAFLIKFLLEKHKQNCKKIFCFCKKSKLSLKISPMIYYKKKLEGTMLFEALMLLEEMLSRVVIKQKRKNSYVLYCYINFLISYMAKPNLAYKLINIARDQNSGRFKKSGMDVNLELNALTYLLEYVSWKNLDTGKLSLLALEYEIGDYSKKSNKMKILDHILFLNRVEMMKKDIKKGMEFQVEFLKSLIEKGEMKICYDFSVEFYDVKKKIFSRFENLVEISKGRYAPLYLNFGSFVLNCCQNRVLASRLLNNYMKRMILDCNLHEVFSDFEVKGLEFSTVYVSTKPEEFHRIVYASSNMFKYTGFKNFDLLNKNLKILLPKPLQSWHESFMNPTKMKGNLLMSHELMQLFCLKKNGVLIPIKIGLRLNTTVENGVQYCGVLNFQTDKYFSCSILLTTRTGMITSLTQPASNFFVPGTSLNSYNKMFQKVYEHLNQVSDEKLMMKNKGEKFEIILKDKKRMGYWATYCEWNEAKNINLFSKTGKILNMSISFQDYHIYGLKKFFRIMIIHRTKNQIFNNFFINEDAKKLEEKSLKKIMNYIKIDKINAERSIFELEEINEHKKDFDEFEDFDLKKRLTASRKISLKLMIRAPSEISEEEEQKEKILETGRRKHKLTFGIIKKKEEYAQIEEYSPSDHSKLNDSEILEDFEIDKNFSTGNCQAEKTLKQAKKLKSENKRKKEEKEKIKILNFNFEHKKSERDSSGSSVNIKNLKSNKIEKILSQHYKLEKKQKINFITIAILIFLFTAHIVSVMLKDPIIELTNSDLKAQSVNIDMFSWEIYAHTYSVYFTEVCRIAKEGWVDNNAPLEKFNTTLFKRCHPVKKAAGGYHLPPDNLIDINLRNIKLKWLYRYNEWVNTEIKIENFSFENFKKKNLNGKWGVVVMRRRGAVKFMQNLGFKIAGRDYENDTSIPGLGLGRERDKDVEEEVNRRNCLGDMGLKYVQRSFDFYEYLKGVAQFNQDFILYSVLLPCVLSVLIYLMFFLYSVCEVKAMKKFYEMVLDLKEGDLNKTIQIYEKKFRELKVVLLEEKVYESLGKRILIRPETYLKKLIQKESKEKKYEKKGGKRSKKSNSKKVKIKGKKFYFGFFKLLVVFIISISVILLMQIVFYKMLIPKGEKIKNLVKVYILLTELWSSFALIHTVALETILWNNTLNVWGKDSLSVFRDLKSHIKNNILDNLTQALDYDMGNYTEVFVNQMIIGNSCETVWGFEAENHIHCNIYYDGLLNSNFLSSIKGITNSLERYIERWELERNDFNNIKNIINTQSLQLLLTQLQPILTTMYYSTVTEVTNSLMKELEEDLEFPRLAKYFMIGAVFVACTVIYFQVVEKVSFLMRNFLSIVFLFPVCLLERNFIMKHHLKRVSKGGHLWKF